jgi:hypothetical protein
MNIIEKPLTSKTAMLRQTQGTKREKTRCQSGRRLGRKT